MSEHTPDVRPSEESLARGYEVGDVQSGPLVLSALVLAVAVALVCAFLSWFIGRLEVGAARRDPTLSPLATGAPPRREGPQLQTDPAKDLAEMRSEEERALHGYRWIDKEKGVVQLPIDRAMDLLLEQGLPQTSAEVPGVEPAEKPGDSGEERRPQ